ncbi:5-methyltetrahydrofolate--homocysteine methyltransferase [Betaproteobacteria bacterium]|nr:5-methyltetrahydrofolate--homocysteine methyltransferase [Betaproteobacteria bacterium]
MADIALRFDKDVLVLEGAMGTMLQKEGIPSDECAEMLNIMDPELIQTIHQRYQMAGAQCAITNTFGASRSKLDEYGLGEHTVEINRAGVRLARNSKAQHVLADVGPCGKVLEPIGKATFDEVYKIYAEQIKALAAENPDAILIETMVDIADARCALIAAKDVCDLPVIVSCTFDAGGRMELSGTPPEAAAVILEALGASAVGMNCGVGPQSMLPLLQRMAATTTLPLLVQPNAGMPYVDEHGDTRFPGTADEMAEYAGKFRQLGAQLIGSCCGTTPTFTGAIYAAVGDTDVVSRPAPDRGSSVALASPNNVVYLGSGRNCAIIGERINPTGKAALAEQLEQGNMSIVREFAASQQQNGAALIDVNVGAPLVDAKVALPAAALALVGFTTAPLVFDTTDAEALEAALRVYPGRALINSVNGDPASCEAVLPLAKRYGASIIALALDETGIPKTVAGRIEIVNKIRSQAHAHGLSDSDLLVDMLVMTAATDETAPGTTVEGVREVTELGLATVLGVSNVSHGLPNRPLLNAAFVRAAISAGLSAAIANPDDQIMRDAIGFANVSETSLASALAAWDVSYQQALASIDGQDEPAAKTSPDQELDATVLLKQAVKRGDKDIAPALVDEVIAAGMAPEKVVDDLLAPTLQELGDAFGRGEAFLPQMMVAATAMMVAVERIRTYLPEGDDDFLGKIIFCTVKGDVHSIGKDICIALLESQGFKVYDLGVDVDPQDVLAKVREVDANLVCLSALMTTTLKSMQQTVDLIFAEEPSFVDSANKAVLVGGAVVTERWAQSVGAGYTGTAPELVELARRICSES